MGRSSVAAANRNQSKIWHGASRHRVASWHHQHQRQRIESESVAQHQHQTALSVISEKKKRGMWQQRMAYGEEKRRKKANSMA